MRPYFKLLRWTYNSDAQALSPSLRRSLDPSGRRFALSTTDFVQSGEEGTFLPLPIFFLIFFYGAQIVDFKNEKMFNFS